MIDLYVAADNGTDRRAEVATAYGAAVFECFDRHRASKGYALKFPLDKSKEKYGACLVFAADNAVNPNYIREINKTFSTGCDIVTGYRNSKNYGDNRISPGYGLWFLREAQHLNCPRASSCASCGISGTGSLFSRHLLEQCSGWNFFRLP